MFKLKTTRTYPWPVALSVVDENGEEMKGEFTATFRVQPAGEVMKRGKEPLLDVVLVGLQGLELQDEEGNAVADTVAAAKDDPQIRQAIQRAYFESLEKKTQPS